MKYSYGNFDLSPCGKLIVETRKTREEWNQVKSITNCQTRKTPIEDTRGFFGKIFKMRPLDLDYEFPFPTEKEWIEEAKRILAEQLKENELVEGRIRYYHSVVDYYGGSVRNSIIYTRYF